MTEGLAAEVLATAGHACGRNMMSAMAAPCVAVRTEVFWNSRIWCCTVSTSIRTACANAACPLTPDLLHQSRQVPRYCTVPAAYSLSKMVNTSGLVGTCNAMTLKSLMIWRGSVNIPDTHGPALLYI